MLHNENQDTKARLVNAIVPHHKMWGVYYDKDKDELFTLPVLFLSVWEKTYRDEGFDKAIEYRPVTFSGDGLFVEDDEPSDHSNLLGYSLTEAVKREEWEEEIETYKTRNAARRKTA